MLVFVMGARCGEKGESAIVDVWSVRQRSKPDGRDARAARSAARERGDAGGGGRQSGGTDVPGGGLLNQLFLPNTVIRSNS